MIHGVSVPNLQCYVNTRMAYFASGYTPYYKEYLMKIASNFDPDYSEIIDQD